MPRGRDTDYSPYARLIFTDRARDLDDATTWEAFPNLVAVAADQLHRCLEVEACSGGKTTRLSALLRKARRKSPPPTSAMVATRGSLYFSCARDGAHRRLARSKEERKYMDPSYWKPDMREESLAKLEEDYIRKPFTSRAEYFQVVMALLRSPLFADQMARRH